jgi:hypothetical protein
VIFTYFSILTDLPFAMHVIRLPSHIEKEGKSSYFGGLFHYHYFVVTSNSIKIVRRNPACIEYLEKDVNTALLAECTSQKSCISLNY